MRRVWFTAFLTCFSLLFGQSLGFAEWYKGIIHVHSRFSDGTDSLEQLQQEGQKSGLQFMMVTDHADLVSFSEYLTEIAQLNQNSLPLLVPGEEYPLTDVKKRRHLLILGIGQNGWYLPYYQQEEMFHLQDIALAMTSNPALVGVIAHHSIWDPPANLDLYFKPLAPKLPPVVSCLEFFNVGWEPGDLMPGDQGAERERQDLELYLRLLKEGYFVAVTCGNDFHRGPIGAIDSKFTFINAETLTLGSLLSALKEGKSYASVFGAQIEGLNLEIGNTVNQTSTVEFNFKLVFPQPLNSDKEIVIYRDGEILPQSYRNYSIQPNQNIKELNYSFRDQTAGAGMHTYVIYSPSQLITSPILVDIDPLSDLPAEISKGASFIPIEIENEVNHLGDDRYNSPLNVGFTKNSEGLVWQREFEIDENLLSAKEVWLQVRVKGAELRDPVWINGEPVASLLNSEENNGKIFFTSLFPSPLKGGQNVIEIRSVTREWLGWFGEGIENDWDDFEFSEIKLFFLF